MPNCESRLKQEPAAGVGVVLDGMLELLELLGTVVVVPPPSVTTCTFDGVGVGVVADGPPVTVIMVSTSVSPPTEKLKWKVPGVVTVPVIDQFPLESVFPRF
jgi:hypothetical protein